MFTIFVNLLLTDSDTSTNLIDSNKWFNLLLNFYWKQIKNSTPVISEKLITQARDVENENHTV